MYNQILSWWHSKNIKTSADLAEVLNSNKISFAYNSSKIENEEVTYHDTREIFENDKVSSYTGKLRTIYELRNARIAYDYFIDSFQSALPLDEQFLKNLQKRLTMNTYDSRRWAHGERPGSYKIGDYVTGKDEIGALPEDVHDEINELLEQLQEVDNKNALTAAAYFHVKFENIHPFADGNGRTGRLAMNYFLVLHDHPPITIHEEDRNEYFSALEAWDKAQSLEPMKTFLIAQTEKTWCKQITRLKSHDKQKKTLKDIIKASHIKREKDKGLEL